MWYLLGAIAIVVALNFLFTICMRRWGTYTPPYFVLRKDKYEDESPPNH